MEFRTQFNFDPSLAEEVMDQTLVTEPGLAMDVPTMLRRYAQGTLQGLSIRNPQFDDLDEPDPTESPDWDITDAEEYLRNFGVRHQQAMQQFEQSQQPQQPQQSQQPQQPQQSQQSQQQQQLKGGES